MRRAAPAFALAGLAGLVALAAIRARGMDDMNIWMSWVEILDRLGLVGGYAAIADRYPPGISVIWYVTPTLTPFAGLSPRLVVKLSLAAFLFASAIVAWRWSRDWRAAAAILAALVVPSAALAFTDIYYAPPFLLAWRALAADRRRAATLWFALACAIKFQPLVVAPFFVVHLAQRIGGAGARRRIVRPALAAALPPIVIAALACAVFGLEPLKAAWRVVQYPRTTAWAPGMPWVVHRLMHLTDPPTGPYPLEATFGAGEMWIVRAGAAVFAVVYVALLWRALRARADVTAAMRAALAASLTYLMWIGIVSENHWTLAVLVAAALWLHEGSAWQAFTFWAVALNATVILAVGVAGVQPAWPYAVHVGGRLVLAGAAVAGYVAALRGAAR